MIIFDNLGKVRPAVLDRVWRITGTDLRIVQADVGDQVALERTFADYAVVYGESPCVSASDAFPTCAKSPYGRTKVTFEAMPHNLAGTPADEPAWNIAVSRCLSPVAPHPSGVIGASRAAITNNVLPLIAEMVVGSHERLMFFGDDYPAPDNMGVHCYVHVDDLAHGHVVTLVTLDGTDTADPDTLPDVLTVRLCTVPDNLTIVSRRRPDDAPYHYAGIWLGARRLGWHVEFDTDRACASTWRWRSPHPNDDDPVMAWRYAS